nr:uncharacterized protein CTRU02_02333 [Colletotrichum truncatum]KAF6798360.1 hypothetical protein CTRU02_02333 [Colletotrichum truncatum]
MSYTQATVPYTTSRTDKMRHFRETKHGACSPGHLLCSKDADSKTSNGADRPATALFALIECLLHVNAAPHCRPSGKTTPQCRSMSTGSVLRYF